MIYDCFPFFNEFELLTIRLNELDQIVDRFVLVEADSTHSGKPKPYLFDQRKEFFGKWASKLICVKTSLPKANAATREQFQRQAAWKAVQQLGAKPDDIMLMSDVDEIPAAAIVMPMTEYLYKGDVAFGQGIYQYYLNLKIGDNWMGTRMAYIGKIHEENWDMHKFRHKTPTLTTKDAGWHFGFMGGAERVQKKIQSYMHVEYDRPEFTNLEMIAERMKAGIDPFDRKMPLDDSCNKVVTLDKMPVFVRENPHMFAQWLKPAC